MCPEFVSHATLLYSNIQDSQFHPVCSRFQAVLSGRSDFSVAITTVHRPVTSRFERNLGILTTLGTCCGEHLAGSPVTTTSLSLCFPCLSTAGAAFRLIGVTFGLEEFLLFSAESEIFSTIGTLKRLVLKIHWMTSSHIYSSWCSGHPILNINQKNF
jgi:hypothetical protein